ncbi:peptidase [Candidatus Woesearchaeota archaeon]|nr:peptidase [Candidatus Woesearchaeota archaeon]MCF7900983.1 peptidase [Candidatus Woesearchaeota archaeon]MCF8013301.1 peptidase [Candidatus Woesearchaeota archaeon]
MDLKKELSKFKPVTIQSRFSELSDWEKEVVKKLVQVSKITDQIFFDQTYSKNKEAYIQIVEEGDIDKLKFFEFMKGPFNRLKHNETFLEGHTQKPGANFYPEDMTKEEFEHYISENPDKKEEFTSEYTLIRRNEKKELIAIPYSKSYKEETQEISKVLKEAAEISQDKTLKNYLSKLSETILKDNYFESDCAWMDLNSKLEPLIGPYEVYEDELFGYKASFESVISILDKKETEKLKHLEELMQEFDSYLPIKTPIPRKGKHSPTIVVNAIHSGGDCRSGIHFVAHNLPNDEKVREEKGSKKVMFKNIMNAKFESCSEPIFKEVLKKEQHNLISFEGYFMHVVLHEISHGIGPGKIILEGKETTVNKTLKETYSTIEELKADICGIYTSFLLEEKNILTKEEINKMLACFLAMTYRPLRFGLNEAHAGSNIIILNYFKEKNNLIYDEKENNYTVNFENIRETVKSLATKVLTIQANGDYEGAKKFIEKYKTVNQEIKDMLKKMEHIPVDINITYELDEL